mgnify:CR=1 FL=1
MPLADGAASKLLTSESENFSVDGNTQINCMSRDRQRPAGTSRDLQKSVETGRDQQRPAETGRDHRLRVVHSC